MKKFFIFLTILAVYSFQSFSQEYVIPLNSKKSNIEVVRNTKSDLQMVFSLSDIYGNNVTSKNGDEFVELNFDQGFTSGEFGTPKLPVFSKLIQIPFDAEVSISVNNYTSKEYSLEDIGINHKIYPIQPSIRKDQDLDKVPFEYKKEAYEREGFLKNPIATVKVLGTLRGVRIARVEVFPIDYDPANGKLLVRNDIEVAFQFSGANTELENKVRLATASPYFDQIYAQLANSDTKDAYDDHPDNTKYPIKMLIISDRMFEGTLAPYIEWKTKKGFYVEVAYTDVIGTSASVIKTYIHNIYNAATPEDPAPTFVVFVGDTPQIPASQIGTQSAKATDLYYCSVDGDYFPEMYYGRLSATTTQQLQNILDKILYYEQYQFDDPTYLNDMNLIAGADASWNPAVGQPTLKYGTAYYFNDAHGFNTIYEYGVDNDPNNTIEQSDYTGCYGADQLKVSMINYTAHCSETSWGTPNLTSTTINGMTNANKYPLSIGNCCLSAEFGYGECIGESWIRAANKGAVTYIGSSPSSYWHEDFYWAVGAFPYSTGGYVPTFEETTTGSYDAPFVSDYVSTGGLVFVGNLAVTVAANNGYEGSNKLQYYWEAYNVLGDPSLVAYLTEGETNVVSHMPTLPIGVDSYNVVALPGSYVAISKDGVIHGTALVDNSGSVDVSIVPVTDGGNVDIVVTRPQTIPYTAQVPAAALEGPYITLDSYQVNDASGNANGLADFDESFTLNVTLKNVGADNATGVTATISGTDTHFSITASGPTSFGDIASGETGNTSTVNNAFSFDLTNNVPDQYSKTFLLTITDGEDVWESNLSLTANAPDLSIGTLSIDDAAGNSDGIVDPGETANLIVTLNNHGAASVSDADAWMTLLGGGSSYLTVNDTQLSATDITAGGNITVTFNVTADAGTPLGTPVDFTVDLEAGASGQYSASGDKQIIIGFVPEYCESYATSASWSDLTEFTFGPLENITPLGGTYDDFTEVPELVHEYVVGETYDVSITLDDANSTSYTKGAKVFIDWNYDGDFDDEGETAFTVDPQNQNWTAEGTITIPADAPLGQKFLRAVVKETSDLNSITPCGTYSWGGTEDYKIILVSNSTPSAKFSADKTSVLVNETVTFTDNSSSGDAPEIDSWSWNFGEGANPATATGQGPHAVTYSSTGNKTVSLTITVDGDDYTETKVDYISVTPKVDDFPWAESFEGATFPPQYWSMSSVSANTWTTSTGYTIGTTEPDIWDIDPQDGSQFAFVQWIAANQDEWLVTPVFDFTSLNEGELSFWFLGSYEWSITQNNCDLTLKVSLDGGAWTDLWDEHDHPDFNSDEATYIWIQTIIDLSAYAGENHVRFAFVYTGNNGANFNIDNLQITGQTLPVPTVTWPTSASGIDYGDLLSASTLSGDYSAEYEGTTVSGTCAFTNPSIMPPAGTYAASVTFTPTDDETYSSVTGTVNVAVAHRTVTLSGEFTVADKEYDGTTVANIGTNSISINTLVSGDDVSLVPVLAYADANANNGISVTLTGDTDFSGDDASNYILDLTGAPSSTGNILAREIEVTADDAELVYGEPEGGYTYTVTQSELVGDDTFTGELSREVGDDVGLYAIQQGTLDAGSNYNITFVDGTLTIIARDIEVTADEVSKIYGEVDPALTHTITSGSLAFTDDFTGDLERATGDDVGEYEITQGTLILNDNYNLTFVSGMFNITPCPLEVTADDLSKDYGDDDPALTYTITSGSLVGDDAISGELTREAGEDAGDYAITQGTLTAGDNYEITFVDGTFTINKVDLTITALNRIKAEGQAISFDGTEFTATGLLANGVDEVTSVTLTSDGAVSGAGLGDYDIIPSDAQGTGLANYNIIYVNGTLTVSDLTELTLTGLTADNKEYDGTTSATISAWGTLVGIEGTDDVSLVESATAVFLNRNAGTGKDVRVTGLALTGANAGDYFINPHTVTANITAKELTVGGTFTASDKTYNGNTEADINPENLTLVGVVAPDQVELNATGAFASKTVGSSKTVSLTDASSITGVHEGNYSLSLTGSPTATANISALTIAATNANAQNKVYDGNTVAVVTGATLTGAITGDAVTLANHTVGTFALATAGTNISVTTAMTLSGADAANYLLEQPAGLTADIAPKPLTISGVLAAEGKTYDGTTVATLDASGLTLPGVITGETVTLTGVTATFAQAGIGEDIAVALTTAELSGATATCYTLSLEGAPATTADIAAKELTIGGEFTANDKEYDGTTAATIDDNDLELVGVVGSEDVDLTSVVVAFADAEVGEAISVSITAAELEGDDIANYTLSLVGAPTATADITAPVVPEYTLTLTIEGSGSVEVDGVAYTEVITADEGTELELEAIAEEGWRFVGWSGDMTGTENPATHTLAADVAVTATFELIPEHTLTVTVVGSGEVTVNGDTYEEPVVVLQGTELTLDVIAAEGWEFDGWSGDLTGSICPAAVEMNADCGVTATFVEATGVTPDALSQVRVYPNPFGGELRLSGTRSVRELTIANLIGQRLVRMELSGEESVTIATGHLARGIYLVTLTGQNGEKLVKKLVKE